MSLQGNATGKALRGNVNRLYELRGYSAYEVAVINGYSGTEEEWLESLNYILTEADKQEIADILLNNFVVAEGVGF